MPFEYESPPGISDPLRLGEILGPVTCLEGKAYQTSGTDIPFVAISKRRVVVITPACDLEQDFGVRFALDPSSAGPLHRRIPNVLMCDVFDRDEIRADRMIKAQTAKQAESNNVPRFQYLRRGEGSISLPDLYIDFSSVFAIPTYLVYEGIRSSEIGRLAVIPSPHVYQLLQRFGYFRSRIEAD